MQSWIFSIITPVCSVTRSFRNHSNMLYIYSCYCYYYFWKQLCCLCPANDFYYYYYCCCCCFFKFSYIPGTVMSLKHNLKSMSVFSPASEYFWFSLCLQINKLDKAVAAANTFFMANPDHVEMKQNLEYYGMMAGVQETDFKDLEERPHMVRAMFINLNIPR